MRTLLTYLVFAALTVSLSAAEILYVSDEENDIYTNTNPNCTITVSGLIEKGDARRLASLVQEHLLDANQMRTVFYPVICFDSPGGSFTEAVKLIGIIDKQVMGTMIGDGARCESACALAFLSGGYPEEGNTYPWRMMHPGAKLGFHAPDLTLASGQYNERDVARAYRIALKSVSETVEKLVMSSIDGNRRMAPSLLAQMLDTPSGEMHYVDTVDEAGRWSITVVSVGQIQTISDQALVRACSNKRSWEDDESAMNDSGLVNLDAVRGSDFSYERSGNKIKILFFGMYVEGCEFTIRTESNALAGNTIFMSGIDDVGTYRPFGLVDAAIFHDPRTKLEALR